MSSDDRGRVGKRRRSVAAKAPRYPRGDVGRRRFLRDLGLGAATLAALPLAGCESEHRGTGGMPDSGGYYERYRDSMVRDALPDAGPVDMFGMPDSSPSRLDLVGDGQQADQGPRRDVRPELSTDSDVDAERPDGGIPDGAGADSGVSGTP